MFVRAYVCDKERYNLIQKLITHTYTHTQTPHTHTHPSILMRRTGLMRDNKSKEIKSLFWIQSYYNQFPLPVPSRQLLEQATYPQLPGMNLWRIAWKWMFCMMKQKNQTIISSTAMQPWWTAGGLWVIISAGTPRSETIKTVHPIVVAVLCQP